MLKAITAWPAIVQGALGSAVFWLALELARIAARRLPPIWRRLGASTSRNARSNEYVERKMAAADSPVAILLQHSMTLSLGFQTLYLALATVAAGMILLPINYICSAVLFVYSMTLLFRGFFRVRLRSDTSLENLKRVAELELQLFGAVAPDTLEQLEKKRQETNPARHA